MRARACARTYVLVETQVWRLRLDSASSSVPALLGALAECERELCTLGDGLPDAADDAALRDAVAQVRTRAAGAAGCWGRGGGGRRQGLQWGWGWGAVGVGLV